MLDQAVKNQVKSAFSGLKNQYTFHVQVHEEHAKKTELVELLNEVASCSDKIIVKVEQGSDLAFTILKNDASTDIHFRAVPTGHEFTTLLVAVLNLDGIGKNLPDSALTDQIKGIKENIHLKSYISLTCTNCPEVVQALNVITMLNPHIKHEIIDGAINAEEVAALEIQAVPTVYANDSVLHIGRSSLGELFSKLGKQFGSSEGPSSVKSEKSYDVVVVGGGPAGVSAAVYSARKGFSVAIIAEKIGGQVTETVSIENMISITQTTGSELSANLVNHLNDYPIDILENRLVTEVEVVDGHKNITTSLGELIKTEAMVIATGASWRKLGVPGEEQYMGSGVAFCTHCDGPFYKGKKVVVVGGGNSGLEAAIDLSSIASEVTILEFMDELKGDQILQDKVNNLDNVRVITSAETKEVLGDGSKVTSLNFKHRQTGVEETITTDGVFVQIGLKANSSVFKELVKTNRIGEIEIDAHCRTGKPGIYAAGDVSIVPYKQIVIAMGEGSKAALSAFEDKIKNALLN